MLCYCSCIALAQTPASFTLEELRSTYQKELKKVHAPVLQDYLRELNTLRYSSLKTAEQAAVQAEISRVQSIIQGTGLFQPHAAERNPPNTTPAQPVASAESGIVAVLRPEDSSPPPRLDAKKGPPSALRLGVATWQCKALPAGNYELIASYDCTDMPDSAELEIHIGAEVFTRKIDRPQLPQPNQVRLLRLTAFQLKEAVPELKILLLAKKPQGQWFILRQAFISKSIEQ